MRPTGYPVSIDNALKDMTGWMEIIYRGPLGIGYFGRLESGTLYRGGRFATPLKGWWWRPTLAGINFKLDCEAGTHPIPFNVTALRLSPVTAACCVEGCCEDEDGDWV